jgi:hypothetical protein
MMLIVISNNGKYTGHENNQNMLRGGGYSQRIFLETPC